MASTSHAYPDTEDYNLEGEIDYSDIEEKYAVHHEDPLACTVLIDGAPVVGQDKLARLVGAIRKWTDARGVTVDAEHIEMPMNEEGQTKGFFFVTLASQAQAEEAAKRLTDNFDRKHSFTCVPLTAISKLEDLPEEFAEPSEDSEPFKPKEHLKGWLLDPQARDQLVVLQGDDVQVVWNHKGANFEVSHERNKWTEKYCLWSPSGTILASLHGPGVGLWGGPSFSRIHRFPHQGVNFLDFSPFENYLVTLSPVPIEASPNPSPANPFTEEDNGNHIAIWEVSTGNLLRTFPMVQESASTDKDPLKQEKKKVFTWPIFKWSGDEKYFARVTPGQQISVYETPSMGLLDKKSIKIDGVVDFEWAPLNEKELAEVEEEKRGGPLIDNAEQGTNGSAKKSDKKKARENVLAYWLPEGQNQPARVALMAIPSRENLRTKNLFNVADCKLHWQNSGDYLCVKVDRLTKTKKATYCNLEVFRVREKAIPIQVIEIKDTVTAFAWEPKGDRFALITTNDPALGQEIIGSTLRTSIHFYQLDTRKGDFISLQNFDQKTCNRIFWSPRGRHVVFATLGSTTKFDLEFWDVDLDRENRQQDAAVSREAPTGSGITLLTTVEHYGMTSVEWDPSGRYVAAVGSIWLGSMEPGFTIFDFKGNDLVKNTPLEKFKQLIWRPRPHTLIPAAEQKKILKNLRKYGREFDEVDALEEMNVSSELQSHRRRLIDEWNAWRSRTKRALEEERQSLGKVQKALVAKEQEATATLEEWVEEVIEEVEEVVV